MLNIITQSKFRVKTEFKFTNENIFVKYKDSSVETCDEYEYAEISNKIDNLSIKNPWFLNAGIIWTIIGVIQLFLQIRSETKLFPLWLIMGLGCLIWYRVSKNNISRLYTWNDTIIILKDKNHDKIIEQIFKMREEAILKLKLEEKNNN